MALHPMRSTLYLIIVVTKTRIGWSTKRDATVSSKEVQILSSNDCQSLDLNQRFYASDNFETAKVK